MSPGNDAQSGATLIRARSRRQAMDWGLVLASQGIETTIGRDKSGGWQLRVSAQDGQKAIEALRQYQVENRGQPWRQTLPWPRLFFDWGCLSWAGLLALFYWLGVVDPGFKHAGIMDSDAVLSGQWWRIFTAMTLHLDLEHLVSNLCAGILLLGLAMGRFGTSIGLLASFLAGAAGNAFSLLFNEKPFDGLGASGMIMGALGLLSAQTLHHTNTAWMPLKHRFAGITAGIMLFVLYGLAPHADLAAHLGGFLGGLLLGIILVFAPKIFRPTKLTNLGSGIALAILLALTWGLALAKGKF